MRAVEAKEKFCPRSALAGSSGGLNGSESQPYCGSRRAQGTRRAGLLQALPYLGHSTKAPYERLAGSRKVASRVR
jgi:hypothetical protein